MKLFYLLLITLMPLAAGAQKLSKNAQKAIDLMNNEGDLEAALTILEKEVTKNPENGLLYYYLGAAKNRMNPFGGLEEFNKAIELDTTIADAYALRALLLEDTQAALKDLDKAIKLAPDEFGYYFNRSGIRLDAENYEGAIADVDKAYELMPGVLQDIFITKASALSNLGRHEEAINELKQIEENMFMEYNFQFVSGEVKLRSGDQVSACDHFHRAEIIIHEFTSELPEKLVEYLNDCK